MIDAHVHYADPLGPDRLKQIMEECHLTGIALQCIPRAGTIPVEKDAFDFKRRCQFPVYVFGGLSRDLYQCSEADFPLMADQEITRLMEMGCTGIKMLEGKPDVRKAHAVPDFDSPLWEQYWARLEEAQIPVCMHVNDPEEFWDADKVADYVKEAGWFYDETYINNEEQYRQVITVLERHPKLRIVFPHFFFLSLQLDRLGKLLDRFPNMRIDVTPGIELVYNLSSQDQAARDFFHTYQDRILYGTDIGARAVIKPKRTPLPLKESRSRVKFIREFLETEGDYTLVSDGNYVVEREPTTIHGLGLSPEILQKIYNDNFLNFIS